MGGGTKTFYGEAPRGEPLCLRDLAGITSYEPSELVVTVRAGTPLGELESVLAEKGQCLPFEPPRFAAGGTVGGMVAAGLAGPSRAAAGALRDYVLGLTLLDGRGELLTFGGQVMKNVAGYDVSRLIAGSWGVLGIICEVSLKVLAAPAYTLTLEYDWDEPRALMELARRRAEPLPLHASAWCDGCLRIRLAGSRAAVLEARARLDGRGDGSGARRSCFGKVSATSGMNSSRSPPTSWSAAPPCGDCRCRRPRRPWRWRAVSSSNGAARSAGGVRRRRRRRCAPRQRVPEATRRWCVPLDKPAGAFAPLGAELMRIHRALKTAFDPERILNPGRLYADL